MSSQGTALLFQEGVQHHAAGRLEQAYALYRRVVESDPGDADCHFKMGLLTAQIGRNDLALEHVETAIGLEPHRPPYQLQRGMILAALGRLQEAEACYRLALVLKPDYPEAHNNLAGIFGRLGRLAEAESHFRAALALDPAMPEAYNNLGSTLNYLGRPAEAEEAFRRALLLRPNFAAALNSRGVSLVALGRFEEAEASIRESVRCAPEPSALRNLGNLLAKSRRLDEAAECYREAIRLKPDDALAYKAMADLLAQRRRLAQAEAWYRQALRFDRTLADAWNRLGIMLSQLGRQSEAIACYDEILGQRPDFVPALVNRCIARLPVIYHDEAELERARADYAGELAAICRLPANAVSLETISGALPFYLAYQGRADRDLQALYGRLVVGVMANYYPEYSSPPAVAAPLPGEKIRVGFLSAYFKDHSNWKIPLKGWLSGLDRNRFQIFGYHLGDKVDDETALAERLCHRFVQGLPGFESWAETIRADCLHVLVIPGIGLDAMTERLAGLRLAPVQAASWGHPDTTGLPTIDHYLSSDLMEPEAADAHYTERLIRLPNLSIAYEPLPPSAAVLSRAEIGVPEEAILYWCCQALYKYLPRHDRVFARIAAEVPEACFVFIEYPHGADVTAVFRARLDAAFAACGLDAAVHCRFVPPLTGARFAAIGRLADVFLDSLGWSGCNTTFEALASDLPVITLEGELMRGRHGSAILTMLGMTEMIARTPDEFVALAVTLGRDPEARRDLRRRIARDKHRLYHDPAAIDGLARYLEEAARGIGTMIPNSGADIR
jgi:protein O-GlcNAc transferase